MEQHGGKDKSINNFTFMLHVHIPITELPSSLPVGMQGGGKEYTQMPVIILGACYIKRKKFPFMEHVH